MKKKIAIPVDENGILDTHFGHCIAFIIISVENEILLTEEKVVPPPHKPGLLPKWLAEKEITDVIAGGLGQKAIQIFNHYGINVFIGAPILNASKLVKAFLSNSLKFNANYCNH